MDAVDSGHLGMEAVALCLGLALSVVLVIAGIVAVLHPDPARRADARDVLARVLALLRRQP